MDILTKQKLRITRSRLQEHNLKGAEIESDWHLTAENCPWNRDRGLCTNHDNKHYSCSYVVCPELDKEF